MSEEQRGFRLRRWEPPTNAGKRHGRAKDQILALIIGASLTLAYKNWAPFHTIQPSSLALSLASFQAEARNSDTRIGMRGSSLSEMRFASSPGEFLGL